MRTHQDALPDKDLFQQRRMDPPHWRSRNLGEKLLLLSQWLRSRRVAFRSDWQLDGWQYGFLQGVGKSSSRAAGAKNLDITLYTVHPGGERRFVARLPKTEALDAAHAQTALSNFSNSGLLKICDKEIRDVGGKPFPTVSALQVVNVRFRAEDIEWFMPDSFASASDPLRRWNRYQLYQVGGMSLPRASRGGLPKGGSYWREGSGRCFIPADHSKIQRKLYRALVKKHGAAQVFAECWC